MGSILRAAGKRRFPLSFRENFGLPDYGETTIMENRTATERSREVATDTLNPAELAGQLKRLTPMQEKVLLTLPRQYARFWAPIGWLLGRGLIEQAPGEVWHLTPSGEQVATALRQRAAEIDRHTPSTVGGSHG